MQRVGDNRRWSGVGGRGQRYRTGPESSEVVSETAVDDETAVVVQQQVKQHIVFGGEVLHHLQSSQKERKGEDQVQGEEIEELDSGQVRGRYARED